MDLIMKSVYFIAICALIGCNHNNSGNNNVSSPRSPKTKEEALSNLSQQHKNSLEIWQKSIIKSCDASEAFGLGSSNNSIQKGIDGAALLTQNSNSLIFSEGEDWLVLTDFDSMSGISASKAEESHQFDGATYSISAEAKREGSHCSLFLFGHKIYETSIFQSATIGSHYFSTKTRTLLGKTPQFETVKNGELISAKQHEFYSVVNAILSPSKESQKFIAKKLELDEKLAQGLFQIKSSSDLASYSAIQIANSTTNIWNSPRFERFIGAKNTIEKLFDGDEQRISLTILLPLPVVKIGEIKNTADEGYFRFNARIVISKTENQFNYTIKNLQNEGLFAFDTDAASSCTKDRFESLFNPNFNNSEITPSVRELSQPCLVISPQINEVLYRNGFYQKIIPIVFGKLIPSSRLLYNGWDEVLSRLVLEIDDKDGSIRGTLDPSNETKIISRIERDLSELKTILSQQSTLIPMRETLQRMILTWAFNGAEIPTNHLTRITKALANTADVFVDSTNTLIRMLAKDPTGIEKDLVFAESITAEYKNLATKSLQTARSLNYSSFETEVFSQILQIHPTLSELTDWYSTLSTIQTQIQPYGQLDGVKNSIVAASVRWIKKGEITTNQLNDIYKSLNNSIVPFEESTIQLITDLSISIANQQSTLRFASELTQEYKAFATSIRDQSLAAGYENWGKSFFRTILQKQLTFENLNTFNEMWKGIIAFIQREKQRLNDDSSSMPEWNRKKILDVAIKEIWTDGEFKALESVAIVAKHKSICERHRDISSMVECAGLKLFSKQPKMFFDPNFNGRYFKLGADFNQYLGRLNSSDWFSLRFEMLNSFFGSWEPLWSKCDNSAFQTKNSLFGNQIQLLLNERDTFKRWELERKTKEILENCK